MCVTHMFYAQHGNNITANTPGSRAAHAKEKPISVMVQQSTEKWGLKNWGKYKSS